MFKNDGIRLHHILDAAQEAVAFSRSHTRKDLDTERMLTLSLIHLLEVIGEAARGLSPAYREVHSGIVWTKIIGMRDRLIHGYFDINLDVVWKTVTEDLPPLITQLEKILSSESE
jgi:uncharacterized protein with HEPN domain